MKHGELVNLAKYWLLSAKQCNPVFTERGSAKSKEMPDAIGWNSTGSIVVECKTSMADFMEDLKKPFRFNPIKGMGKYRYFVFTQELYSVISKKEMPLPKGWGVAAVNNRGSIAQIRLKHSKEWLFNIEAELYYLRNRIFEIQKFGR